MTKIFAHPIQLREVIIEKVNCRRIGKFDAKTKPSVNLSLKGKTLSNSETYSYLTIKIDFPEVEQKPFFLEIIVRGLFVTEIPVTRAKLKQFAEKGTLVSLSPWAREAVATITRQMGFPSFMLPLIDVKQTLKAVNSEEETSERG